MKKIILITAALAVFITPVLMLITYYVASPLITLSRINSAVQSNDQSAIFDFIDWPAFIGNQAKRLIIGSAKIPERQTVEQTAFQNWPVPFVNPNVEWVYSSPDEFLFRRRTAAGIDVIVLCRHGIGDWKIADRYYS